MIFGQIVIGPPGSGKTTYCKAMKSFMKSIGRKAVIINLDPGNDDLPYECLDDISELVTTDDAMQHEKLGPNGGLLFCMEYLEENMDWLLEKVAKLTPDDYVLFDCPGQNELYSTHHTIHNIVKVLTKGNKLNLCAVHLVDSLLCSRPNFFISALSVSLSTMLKIQLPHVNLLTKVDLIEKRGHLPFNLDFYTDVLDLEYMIDRLEEIPLIPVAKRRKIKLFQKELTELITDYSLVHFIPMHIEDRGCLMNVLKQVDKANGYMYGRDEERVIKFLTANIDIGLQDQVTNALQEKFIDSSTKGDFEN